MDLSRKYPIMVLYPLERMRDEMNNEKSKFDIRFNAENGGVDSMIFRDDPQQMNWMGIRNTWGTVKDATVVSVECEKNSVCAAPPSHNGQSSIR